MADHVELPSISMADHVELPSTSGESSEEEARLAAEEGRQLPKLLRQSAVFLLAVAVVAFLSLQSPPAKRAREYFLARVSDGHIISEWGEAPCSYDRLDNTWCVHQKHEFGTLEEAQAACAGDCQAIYSIRCNPVYGYALCKGRTKPNTSPVGSCTFVKLGATFAEPPPDFLSAVPGALPATPAPPAPPALLPPTVPASGPGLDGLKAMENAVVQSKIPTDDIQSANCKLAVFAMEKGMCPPGAGLKSTCAAPKAAMEQSCEGWFGTMAGISDADKAARIAKCKETAAKAARRDEKNMVAPATEEEQKLCIQCDMDACTSKPTFVRAKELVGARPQRPAVNQRFPPTGGPNHCRPMGPDGQPSDVQRRVRREIHQWNDYDFEMFRKAVNDFHDRKGAVESVGDFPNTYGAFAAIHPMGHPDGPFVPWHRHQLFDLETQLQKVANNCSLTLPYWNSNLEAGNPLASFVWHPSRYGGQGGSPTSPGGKPCRMTGGGMGYCLVNGIAANWKIVANAGAAAESCDRCVHRSPQVSKLEDSVTILSQLQMTPVFEDVNSWLGDTMHVIVHWGTVGGTMGAITYAARDPVFFLHHAYVDRLFNWWQRYHAARGRDTSTMGGRDSKIMRHWNEPAGEWIGKHDLTRGCTLLPRSNPRACLEYESEMPVPEARGGR